MVAYTVNWNGICENIWTSEIIWAGGETAVAGAHVTKTNDIWHTLLFNSERHRDSLE
jgi:hypothetical protein